MKFVNPFDQFLFKQISSELFHSNEWKFIIKYRLSILIMSIYSVRLFLKVVIVIWYVAKRKSDPKHCLSKENLLLEHINQSFFNNDSIFLLTIWLMVLLGIVIRVQHKFHETYEDKNAWYSLFDLISVANDSGNAFQCYSQKNHHPWSLVRYFAHIPRDIRFKMSNIHHRLNKIICYAYLNLGKPTECLMSMNWT